MCVCEWVWVECVCAVAVASQLLLLVLLVLLSAVCVGSCCCGGQFAAAAAGVRLGCADCCDVSVAAAASESIASVCEGRVMVMACVSVWWGRSRWCCVRAVVVRVCCPTDVIADTHALNAGLLYEIKVEQPFSLMLAEDMVSTTYERDPTARPHPGRACSHTTHPHKQQGIGWRAMHMCRTPIIQQQGSRLSTSTVLSDYTRA